MTAVHNHRPRRLPAWFTVPRVLAALAAAALLILPVMVADAYYQNMLILTLVIAVAASGLNIITGFAGYVSLGHSAFIGIGGYTMGVLATRFEGTSPWTWVPAAGVVGAVLSLILGFVSLRSRGPAFVVITVALLSLLSTVAVNWTSVTNGSGGLTLPIPPGSIDTMNLPFHYALVLLLALQLAMSWWIRRTKLGIGLVAIREDEGKAATVGVDLPTHKIVAFVASSVFVGMAGAVYGYYLTFIDPTGMFGILLSLQIMLSLLIGGRGTLFGPVIGAFLVEPVNEFANTWFGGGNSRLLIFGGLLMVIVLFLPDGLASAVSRIAEQVGARGRQATVGRRLTDAFAPERLGRVLPRLADTPEHTAEHVLEVRDLTKRFGGVQAVDGCSLVVPRGSISGLIGPNGSGKTTLFNLIDGTMQAGSGEILLDGVPISGLTPWARSHRGLGRTFQLTRLFRGMTVLENLAVPRDKQASTPVALTRDAVSGPEAERAMEVLESVGLGAYARHRAGALSYGQQKMVELAQVLMLRPRIVLLDEPAGGINPVLVERMAAVIRELNRRGTTFLIVEHNMSFVLDLCDHVTVMAQGRPIFDGPPDRVPHDPAVVEAYLGVDVAVPGPSGGV